MKYCPLMSYQRSQSNQVWCMEENCVFADEAGECLIKQALQLHVSKERTRLANETEAINTYARIYKDGSWKPIRFLNPDEDVKTSTIET